MTIEELRDYVEEQRSLNNIPYHVYSALIDGIDTLEQEPICPSHGIDCEDCPAYDPCGDVISRDAVWDVMQELWGTSGELLDRLMALPSVNPQPCEYTQMIDKSNFSMEQYKADLQSAYDCGKASVAPCEDAISREELLKAIDTWDKFGFTTTGCFVREPKGDYVPYIHYDDVIKSINGMPPVNPQPKTGHLLMPDKEYSNKIWRKCSCCGTHIEKYSKYLSFDGEVHYIPYRLNYCPVCGAKMVEPQESEEQE